MKSSRRARFLKLGIWVAALLALFAAPEKLMAQSRGEVRLGHNRAWANPALILGITKGYFARGGVTISEKVFDNPADIVQAIASGDLDAGVCPTGVLLTAIQRGVKVKAVALAQGSQVPPVTFMVRVDSNINSVKDLRGKTAVISGFGGIADLMLRYSLDKANIDPKKDVTIQFVPFHLTLPSLINRQVDVAPLDSILSERAAEQYPGQLKPLFSYADVSNSTIGNDHVNALLLVFGNAFVERDRDTALQFLEGYVRSIRAMQADPKAALDDWADASNIALIRNLRAPVSLPPDGKVYLDAFRFEAGLAIQFGYLKEAADVTAAVDNSLIQEAATRIK
jgi:NitT/TauT family transport system substrate-binding protein